MATDAIHHIFPASKNTQRLGSMLVIAHLASSSRSMPTLALSQAYSETITTRIPVPAGEESELDSWLRRRNLLRKYSGRGVAVEAQDYLLADPTLASGTGSERGDTRAAVDLATQLGILWPDSNRRTWVGDWLVSGWGGGIADVRSGNRNKNVFKLSPVLKLGFAWAAFTHDADGLGYCCRELVKAASGGSAVSTGSLFEGVRRSITDYLSEARARAVTGYDRGVVARLNVLATSLARTPGGRKAEAGTITQQTLRRVLEDFLFWRLETMVDLGVLGKPAKDGYVYSPTDVAKRIAASAPSEAVLSNRFFPWWKEMCTGRNPSSLASSELFNMLVDVNKSHRNSMGYTLIDEALLTVNANCDLRSRPLAVSTSDILQSLATPSIGWRVLTSVDKNRRLSAFKVLGQK